MARLFDGTPQRNPHPTQPNSPSERSGFQVTVERSPTRVFKDADYAAIDGVVMAETGPWANLLLLIHAGGRGWTVVRVQ